jgi:hypothetical protein
MGHGEVKEMDVKIPDQVKEVLGKRGIKEADVDDVIKTAESSNKKLLVKGTAKIIAKKRIGDVTIYAVYETDGLLKKHATLDTAYSHRMKLGGIVNATDPTNYVCASCNEPAMYGHVEMEYMTVKRNGPAVVCTKCKDSWVEEYLATMTLAAAEGLFEKKRA